MGNKSTKHRSETVFESITLWRNHFLPNTERIDTRRMEEPDTTTNARELADKAIAKAVSSINKK